MNNEELEKMEQIIGKQRYLTDKEQEQYSIEIKKQYKKTGRTIYDLFDGYDKEYVPNKIDWGKPVGKEVW